MAKIQLSDHFTYQKLLRFTLPSIAMMIFTSIYGVVDGYFVSNFVGKTPFAAVNLVYPLAMGLAAVGFMLGAGGSALVARLMGEGERERAEKVFSLLIYLGLGLGAVLSGASLLFLRSVMGLMGAEGELLDDCVRYGIFLMPGLVGFVMQFELESFFVTAEKPQLGLWVTVLSGVSNIVMDALFVAVFHWGLAGAAAATAISQVLGAAVGLIYFARPNSSTLRLGRTHWDGWAVARTCTNGSSELLSNISMSLVGMLYNVQLLRYAGEDGVAAYGVLMYVNMIFLAIFIGYSVGSAPAVSFHYGAQNHGELRSLRTKSLRLIGVASVAMLGLAWVLSAPLSRLFTGYDETLLALTLRAFSIYSFSFLFAGIAIYGSSFFTALNDGLTSAIISFLRTLVFQIAAVIVFPLIWDVDGIWFSIVGAEAMAAAVTALFLAGKRKKYQY